MTASASFTEYLKDCLSVVGPVTVKRMFGGAGVYADGVMFGLVANDVLYFKADSRNENDYIAEELEPFTYDGKNKPIKMSYWQVPERVFDDPDEMTVWAEAALGAARRAAVKKKPAKTAKKKSAVKKGTAKVPKHKKSKRRVRSK
jgi:DNA transformation protein and related proteins